MDSPDIYPLTTVARNRRKREAIPTILLIYLLPVLIVFYLMYRWKFETYMMMICIATAVFALMGIIRDIRKSNRKVDNIVLEIGDVVIRQTRINKHDLVINVAEIRAVNVYDGGLTLVTDKQADEPFEISSDFRNFDQIKTKLEGLIKSSLTNRV